MNNDEEMISDLKEMNKLVERLDVLMRNLFGGDDEQIKKPALDRRV